MNNSVRVLIVDDDEEDALITRELLSKNKRTNFIVESISRYDDAVVVMKQRVYDVYLVDYRLGARDGIELLNMANDIGCQSPIIIMTGKGDYEIDMAAMEAGAADYLDKTDITSDLLVRSIRYAIERNRIVSELRKANQEIIEQQRSVIDRERLKVLFEMSGATAHNLNQPLTALLGRIELMRMHKGQPDKIAHHMEVIEKAVAQMAEIVRKIQDIRRYETMPYLGNDSIIALDQKIMALIVIPFDYDYDMLSACFKKKDTVIFHRAKNISMALDALDKTCYDVIIMNYILPDGNSFDFLKQLHAKELNIPLVLIASREYEIFARQLITAGVYEYIPRNALSEETVSKAIKNALDKGFLAKEIRRVQKDLVSPLVG